MINIIKPVMAIIGTIIGAGFASGKEIYTFFNRFGGYGFIGIIISGIIMTAIIYKVLKISLYGNIQEYSTFLQKLSNKKNINYIVNCIINIFLLISFYVMVAGFGAYFKQEYNISIIISSLVIIGLSYITFLKNIDGIVNVNLILIPVLILFVILVGVKIGTETNRNTTIFSTKSELFD